MHLVEQHVIKPGDPRFVVIDQAAFAAKNLYNAALYLVRQSFIFENRYLGCQVPLAKARGLLITSLDLTRPSQGRVIGHRAPLGANA